MDENSLKNNKIMFTDQEYTEETIVCNQSFFEIVYVTEGSAVCVINGREKRLNKGSYFICDYMTRLIYYFTEGERIKTVSCRFLPEYIDKTLNGCKSFSDIINNYLIQFSPDMLSEKPTEYIFSDDEAVYKLIKRMRLEIFEFKAGCVELVRCMLIEILVLSLRSVYVGQPFGKQDYIIEYVLEKIHEDFISCVNLSELCREVNYSLPYVSRRFKEVTGLTFKLYIQKLRIEYSCRLLLNDKKKVYEAAELSGYSNLKFFNKTFKKLIGVSPGEYKKK